LLREILKKINKNLLLLKDEQEIKRQRKRLSYLNNYKLSLTIKCMQCNFNILTNFNRSKRDNCNKQSCANINLKDGKES